MSLGHGRESLICRPNSNSAGDLFVGDLGVLRNIISPASVDWVSIVPEDLILARMSFFISFTAASATPFNLGMYGELRTSLMPHS